MKNNINMHTCQELYESHNHHPLDTLYRLKVKDKLQKSSLTIRMSKGMFYHLTFRFLLLVNNDKMIYNFH